MGRMSLIIALHLWPVGGYNILMTKCYPADKPEDRMPTVSASQALQEISSSASSRQLLTGLKELDCVSLSKDGRRGVILRGQVTEIYGPPGVGKTALAMQVAANALDVGKKVAWTVPAIYLDVDSKKFSRDRWLDRMMSGHHHCLCRMVWITCWSTWNTTLRRLYHISWP